MLELMQTVDWTAVLQIIVIDILLGGDNAVVIALACRNLSPKHRLQGVLWGTFGAVALRVVLIVFAVALLKVPLLKLIGGLLLLWIGVKLMLPEGDEDHKIDSSDSLWRAIKTIIIADFVMSLDNVIAIAGAAEQADESQRFALIVFGLLVSIPIIVFGSQLVLKLMDRFRWIIMVGAGLLGWIAGGLIESDPIVTRYLGELPAPIGWASEVIGAALVLGLGWSLARRSRPPSTGSH